ncbi:P-loop NTPase [soil metagenome]
MTLPVLTAVADAAWESELVAALERNPLGVTVVRRCVDVADLLATAATGAARAVLLSADLRRFDLDARSRLAATGVAVVGLVPPGDDAAGLRLHQLGVAVVLPADTAPEALCAAVLKAVAAAVDGRGAAATAYADPLAALPTDADGSSAALDGTAGSNGHGGGATSPQGTGRLLAVWGPTGAPGRTTVAVTVASELARLDIETLLADADVYGGAVAQLLGLLDESPGLAAAARQANTGALDLTALAGLARSVGPHLRVLTGISRADRWPELRPAALQAVWALARALASVTVVDVGFCLEQDEELSFDTAAPRRNGATLATLEAADTVLAVGRADPLGLQRLVRGLGELREAVPDADMRVVVTGVRRGSVGRDPDRQLTQALSRYAGVSGPVLVPDDRAALDTCARRGRVLAEVAPDSPARRALARLTAELVGRPAAPRRRLLARG